MKKPRQMGLYLAVYTKSDFSTMETIPNCTKYHWKFRRKIAENRLQAGFLCGILKQNKKKKCAYLHISTLTLQKLNIYSRT